MKHEIRDRYSNACLYVAEIDDATPEVDRTKRALEKAVAARAYLDGAYLARAYLAGANLDGANLAKEKYGTIEAVLQLGPLGSRNAMLILFRCTKATVVQAGRFTGTVAEFKAAVKKTHGSKSKHARDYAAALAFVAAVWKRATPAATGEKESK
jgi:hypothetical protein